MRRLLSFASQLQLGQNVNVCLCWHYGDVRQDYSCKNMFFFPYLLKMSPVWYQTDNLGKNKAPPPRPTIAACKNTQLPDKNNQLESRRVS